MCSGVSFVIQEVNYDWIWGVCAFSAGYAGSADISTPTNTFRNSRRPLAMMPLFNSTEWWINSDQFEFFFLWHRGQQMHLNGFHTFQLIWMHLYFPTGFGLWKFYVLFSIRSCDGHEARGVDALHNSFLWFSNGRCSFGTHAHGY